MMASKFLHDEGEEDSVINEEWATSGHMDIEELNELERNFLTALVYIIALPHSSSSSSGSSTWLLQSLCSANDRCEMQ